MLCFIDSKNSSPEDGALLAQLDFIDVLDQVEALTSNGLAIDP